MNVSRVRKVEASLCFPIRYIGSSSTEVLLAIKDRGLNAGKLNGFGGKFDPNKDRDIWDTNTRELEEESGLRAVSTKKVAEVLYDYYAAEHPFETMLVSVFLVTEWTGSPVSTTEMRDPKWHRTADIDYSTFPPGKNELWIPRVLAGECLKGTLRGVPGSGITSPAILPDKFGIFDKVDPKEFSRKGI